MADAIERLTRVFERFPGIGPRQAQRFVQYLLRSSPALRRELAESVRDLGARVHQCPSCKRFHTGSAGPCSLCTNPDRDDSLLAVVAQDADLYALERSGTFRGRYFVLGGTISLASDTLEGLRVPELIETVRTRGGLEEVILALPANPEGDATANRLRDELADEAHERNVKVTQLGRGLSTGSELEYADPDTIRSALTNRR